MTPNERNTLGGNTPLALADRTLGALAALILFSMMSITVIDVAGRYLFDRPLPGGFELTQVLLAELIFVSLPLVTARNGHVTITLTDRLFNPLAAAIRDGLVHLVCGLATAGMAWRLWVLADRLQGYGDMFEFIGMPKSAVAYSMCVLAGLTSLVLLFRAGLSVRPVLSNPS